MWSPVWSLRWHLGDWQLSLTSSFSSDNPWKPQRNNGGRLIVHIDWFIPSCWVGICKMCLQVCPDARNDPPLQRDSVKVCLVSLQKKLEGRFSQVVKALLRLTWVMSASFNNKYLSLMRKIGQATWKWPQRAKKTLGGGWRSMMRRRRRRKVGLCLGLPKDFGQTNVSYLVNGKLLSPNQVGFPLPLCVRTAASGSLGAWKTTSAVLKVSDFTKGNNLGEPSGIF